MATQTYSYIAFHSTTYDTSVSYASRLMYLGKKDIINSASLVGLSLPASYTKEKMAGALSEYVLANPERMLAMLDAEEVLLVQELMAAGKNGVVWKRHLLKYHTLKRMVWVLQNYDKPSRKEGMIGEDEQVLAQHLLPFVDEVKALILKEEYQEAVSMLFCLFDCLGRTNVLHEDWFESFLDTCEMNHITLCLSKLRYLYCHLRQHDGLSRDYKYDMDMHLMITNYTHGLFGSGSELDFCSLTADMVCDREEQYGSYQNLSEDIMGYEFDDC